jgi:hypothetical protein
MTQKLPTMTQKLPTMTQKFPAKTQKLPGIFALEALKIILGHFSMRL